MFLSVSLEFFYYTITPHAGMIDAHSHLQNQEFDKDREEIIARAFEGGVKKILVVGTDEASSRRAVALAEKYEKIFAVIGWHPYEFNDLQPTTHDQQQGRELNESIHAMREVLEELVAHPKVVGIGEVGLDYYSHTGERITDKGKEYQKDGFLAQAVLARKHGLPLIIHTRPSSRESDDAYEDLYSILTKPSEGDYMESPLRSSCTPSPVTCNLVLHSYQGSVSMTEKFLALPNVYFSFAGYITYPVKKVLTGGVFDIRESIKIIPIDRILTETDSPYLAPQAVRGMRNEPAYVKYVVEELSRLQGGESGEWKMENGEWKVGNGERRMENGEWEMVERETEKNFEKIFMLKSV